jgi:hypothetical protein
METPIQPVAETPSKPAERSFLSYFWDIVEAIGTFFFVK